MPPIATEPAIATSHSSVPPRHFVDFISPAATRLSKKSLQIPLLRDGPSPSSPGLGPSRTYFSPRRRVLTCPRCSCALTHSPSCRGPAQGSRRVPPRAGLVAPPDCPLGRARDRDCPRRRLQLLSGSTGTRSHTPRNVARISDGGSHRRSPLKNPHGYGLRVRRSRSPGTGMARSAQEADAAPPRVYGLGDPAVLACYEHHDTARAYRVFGMWRSDSPNE
jgi:hypothetical protein